jgi:hypothetical protein
MSANNKTGLRALVTPDEGGLLIQQLQDVFPDQQPINRTYINAWEDERVVDAVRATGRKRDWARQETVAGLAEVQAQHGGGTGIAFAWEMQLLATPVPEQAAPVGAGV